MKVLVGRNELLMALQSSIGVVERRQTLPVLSNFLLEAREDELIVTGTDLELELVARARIQNLEPGKITVPARKLFDICRGLPEGAEVSIEVRDDKATVKSGRSRFALATLKAEEYPAMGKTESTIEIELPQKQLKQLIEKTSFAMAQQDVRYYLNGLLFDFSPGWIRTVATDGHRLAMTEMAVEESTALTSLQVIVPRKSVMELNRLLGSVDDVATVRIGQGQVQVVLDVVQLTTKTIDGRFPDYERVVPSSHDRHVEAERESLRRALARTAILSNEKFKGVRLSLSSGLLKLQTHNPEHEEAEEELEVGYASEDMEIGFNVSYVLDALSAIDSEHVTLELRNSDSSGLLYPSGDKSSKYVIMPMRL